MGRRTERRRLFRGVLRTRFTGHALRGAKLLGYNKAPNGQLVDFQPSDSGATDGQSTDGKGTDGYCAECHCAYCEPTNC
jgi:hypothetical protein